MGESACIVRSFRLSSPTSGEDKKVNSSIQWALSTSASFGRFAYESLDWEKWSVFTHNRHLEEVGSYSKPGSVAEKKKYFEAHFKKRRIASLFEEQNVLVNDASSEKKSETDPSGEFKEVPESPIVMECDSNDASTKTMVESELFRELFEEVSELPIAVEKPRVKITMIPKNDECNGDDIVSKKEHKVYNEDDSNKRTPTSLNKNSSTISTNCGMYMCSPGSVAKKIAYFEAYFKKKRDSVLHEEQNAMVSNLPEIDDKNGVSDNYSSSDLDSAQRDSYAKDEDIQYIAPLSSSATHLYNDASSETNLETDPSGEFEQVPESPTTLENDSNDLSNKTKLESGLAGKFEDVSKPLVEKTQVELTVIPKNGECIGDDIISKKEDKACNEDDSDKTNSSNKRRPVTTSLHMSTDFASSHKGTSPGLHKVFANSRLVKTLTKISKTLTRAPAGGVSKHLPPAENRRTVTPQDDSNSVSEKMDWKVRHQSSDFSKASNTFKGKTRLLTMPTPLTFKTEGAAKRKEFFQKLEQKSKSQETGKQGRRHKSQVKAGSDFKDIRNSIVSKATENTEITSRRDVTINCFRKFRETFSFKFHLSPSGKCFPKKANENYSTNLQI